MSNQVKIKKGADIKLKGSPEKVLATAINPTAVSINPTEFIGVTPKLMVKQGDKVKAGTPVFTDKDNNKITITSPVSGEVKEIVRGEKRKLLEIVIKADSEITYESFTTADPKTLSREQIIEALLNSGVWPFVKQRPYDIVADPSQSPKAIFISAFDSAPLAPDNDFVLHGQGEEFQIGLDAICKLTEGKVHLNVRGDEKPTGVFTNSKGVQINKIFGPHPAGNVGIQIHHIAPINKGDIVWTLKPQDILTIGRLFKTGKYDASRVVAVSGSCAKNPKYFKTIQGICLADLLKDNIVSEKNIRVISGNVLTGTNAGINGYLGFYDYQVTLIPEGGNDEFFGWLAPGLNKFSNSRTFFSWAMPNKVYDLNTNMNGEDRAFVMSGEYESVFPMDIYPVHLLKSIMVEDVEAMEKLGIYEVAPEDFALCEVVCTSKIPAQSIVRKGLNIVKKECS
jgi:Na+-transporting NADH:ubiquinone oxidoreductase subunit A